MLAALGVLLAVAPAHAQSVPSGKFGVMGDSIAAGTHATDMCGKRDIIDCVSDLGGRNRREWSYAAREASRS